jgi:5-(hydroxymethyl)furfural/furfural oxidase
MRRRQGAGGGQEHRIPRERGHLFVGAIHSPAHLLRAGIGPAGHAARSRHRGARQSAGRRPAADGSSVDLGVVVHQAEARHQRHDAPPHSSWRLRYSSEIGGIAARRHVRRRGQQIGLACGRRADRLAAAPSSTRPIPKPARSSSTSARLARRADGRVQPAVRPARPRAADGRLPPARRDADERGDAGRRATRSPPAIPSACAGSAWSTPRTGGSPISSPNCSTARLAAPLLMIDNFIVEGYRFDELMTDDEALENFIRGAAIGVWHATCTCRMGADGDPMAVTDNQGRVRGGQGCVSSTPRYSRWCRAPTPISRR